MQRGGPRAAPFWAKGPPAPRGNRRLECAYEEANTGPLGPPMTQKVERSGAR